MGKISLDVILKITETIGNIIIVISETNNGRKKDDRTRCFVFNLSIPPQRAIPAPL